jgi:cobalt-zinc-cadmium resistance protein CzcA
VNVSDVEAVVSAAVGGAAVTQVIQGEKLFDLVVRMQPQFRSSAHDIGNLLVGTPDGQQIPLSQLADIHQGNGASFIYRENNSRYIGVQYSIEGRDMESAVREGQEVVNKAVRLPQGYRMAWGGEYSQFLEAKSQMYLIGPLALVLIFMILFALYGNFKFPVTIALAVVMTEPVGALVALKLTHTPFSVSSVLGLMALLGVSVETGVILVSYINKLRQEFLHQQTAAGGNGHSHRNSRGVVDSVATDHDDRPGRMPRLIARGTLDRNWIRHAEAVCDCHCCRSDFAAIYRFLRESCALRIGRTRGRCASSLTSRSGGETL